MEELTLLGMSQTMDKVTKWMCQNRLKLNPDKTDFILFGSRPQLRKCISQNITISGATIKRSPVVKHLGVLLDETLSMKDQVTKMSRNAMINLLRIKAIRPYLTEYATQLLVQGLVISHLDYCNIALIGIPEKDLQRIQNLAAKLVFKAGTRDSATACRKDLHWLPCRMRILYKAMCLVYKAIHGLAPKYIVDMMVKRQQKGRAHDRGDTLLIVPFTAKKTFADRSLRVYGPKMWNQMLTKDIRTAKTYEEFTTKLKTHLFTMSYSSM